MRAEDSGTVGDDGGATSGALRDLRPEVDDSGSASVRAALLSRMFGERRATVGRYELGERVGQGGFGVVHAAWDPELRRDVALKLLRTDGDRSAAHDDQLLEEARIAAGLSHPNIVAVHDVGRFQPALDQDAQVPYGGVFVVMELVSGRTLREWLDTTRSTAEIVDVFLQAGRGLAAAHAAGLAHRDFKPSNVLVDDDGRVRVADFGLAGFVPVVRDADSSQNTMRDDTSRTRVEGGWLVGTLPYMAPEQLMGELAGSRSDQYAFCLTLREALEGRSIFDGKLSAQRRAKQAGPPRWRGARRTSRRLRRIVDRGLAAEPSERWPDMSSLLVALETVRRPSRGRLLGVAALGLGGIAMGLWGWVMPREASCHDAAEAIDDIWNPDARARVRRSLLDTEASHASATADIVQTRLDRWVEAWKVERRETCETSRVEPSEAAGSLACLARSSARVAQAVEVLGSADRELLDSAAILVAELPSPELCQQGGEGPLASADEEDVRSRLARADVLISAGRFEDARRVIDTAEADAERLMARPLVVAARATEGSMLAKQGRYEDAETVLREALELGLEVDAKEDAAKAGATLSYVLGNELARSDEGLTVASVATALGRSLGASHPAYAATLYSRGIVLRHAGRLDEAEAEHRRALEIRRRALGPEHPRVLDSMAALSVVLGAQERHEDALALMTETVELRRRLQGEEHPAIATAEVSLGAVLTNMDRFEEAQHVLTHAAATLRRVLGPGHSDYGTALQNLAVVQHLRGESEAALSTMKEVLRIQIEAVGEEHPSVALVRSNLGSILRDLGRLEEARVELRRALEIDREFLAPTDARLATRLRGLAEIEALLGRFDQALWDEALEVAVAARGAEHPSVDALRREITKARAAVARGRMNR